MRPRNLALFSLIMLVPAMIVSGCVQTPNDAGNGNKTGIANPAAAYCEGSGGEIVTVTNNIRTTVYCRLSDGRVCEEWDYFNSMGSACTPPEAADERHYCTDEQRNVDACIEIYMPVCGWNDPEKIQCLVYPCASTYGNSCYACMDRNVAYWTDGKCYNGQQGGGPEADDKTVISSFEECVAAGYHVMESYPRQCDVPGAGTFTESLASKKCGADQDCVVMGGSGDCNCGCFNKDYDGWVAGDSCFCAAPSSCECAEGVCKGIFNGSESEAGSLSVLTVAEARALAEASNCTDNGALAGIAYHNEVTKTWWFDITMDPDSEKPGCSPACVVWDETKATEINWRCTGLLI